MHALMSTLSTSQQMLIQDIALLLQEHPDTYFIVICRKPPVWPVIDPDTWEQINEYTWVCGYEKSAKALVQRGILVAEAYCCYSLTEYGKQVLSKLHA